jgi:large subunit ribosomal protein L14
MIQIQTIVDVVDNSGVKSLKCIKVLGGFQKRYAKVGDLIVVSLQTVKNNLKKKNRVQAGDLYKALVISSKRPCYRKNGSLLASKESFIILLGNNLQPIASRVLAPLGKELRYSRFAKVASLAPTIL